MSVAFPVGIGLALVIGVIVNYLDNPVGDKMLLFAGVGLIALAILLNANAYRKMQTNSTVSAKGLILSVAAGCINGIFLQIRGGIYVYRFFTVPETGKLSPYTAVCHFFNWGFY